MKWLQSPRTRSWIVLATSLIISAGVWRWAQCVLVPAYTKKVVASGRPIGNNSDLYPRWLGARELLLYGRDPYSPEVTRDIQRGFYGRPLDPSKPTDPTAQESFVYPLYVVFLMAPTIRLPFPAVVSIFRGVLLASIVCSIPLWIYAVRLRARWPIVVSGMLLAVGSYPAVEEYYQQNLTALVVLLLAGAAAAAVGKRLWLAGVLLALSTVKPDTTGLMVLWFVLWAAARWRDRRRLVFSLVLTLMFLIGGAEAVLPHWIGSFFAAVREYPRYGTDPSIIQALLPRIVAVPTMAALVVLAAFHCWRWRQAEAGSREFGWALAWVAVVTLAIIPKLAAYNQLLVVPALLVLIVEFRGLTRPLPRMLSKAAFACQIWQWVAASVLAMCSLFVSGTRLSTVAQVPMYTLLAMVPITLAAVLSSAHGVSMNVQPTSEKLRSLVRMRG